MLAGASALTLASGLVAEANAAACLANTTVIGPGVSCTGAMRWTLNGGSMTNNGTITGPYGVAASSGGRVLDTMVNNGTISVTGSAVQAIGGGVIGHLINNGVIEAPIAAAAFTGSRLGTITNTGTMVGGIVNHVNTNLVFIGGSGNTFGTLTGPGHRTIGSTVGGVTFASGNMVLDMNVNTSLAQAMTNSGANVKFINNRTITGNLVQTGGSLMFAASAPTTFPSLLVTGTASLTGGTIVLVPTGAANASEGTYTIISAAGGRAHQHGECDGDGLHRDGGRGRQQPADHAGAYC